MGWSKKPHPPETDLQIRLVAILENILSKDVLFWFCPNGGNLSKAQSGIFKAMGLRKGVPDLHFIWPNGKYGVIELKAGKNKTTPEQDAILEQIEKCGHCRGVAYTVDEAYNLLISWGVPMRGKLY